jgi:hypothetical protein
MKRFRSPHHYLSAPTTQGQSLVGPTELKAPGAPLGAERSPLWPVPPSLCRDSASCAAWPHAVSLQPPHPAKAPFVVRNLHRPGEPINCRQHQRTEDSRRHQSARHDNRRRTLDLLPTQPEQQNRQKPENDHVRVTGNNPFSTAMPNHPIKPSSDETFSGSARARAGDLRLSTPLLPYPLSAMLYFEVRPRVACRHRRPFACFAVQSGPENAFRVFRRFIYFEGELSQIGISGRRATAFASTNASALAKSG